MPSAVIGSLRVDLGIDTATLSKGVKDASGKFAAFGRSLKGLAVAGAAFAGVSASISGVAGSLKSTINAADEMSKAAAKIGIPIEELSRLKYAADLSGVSFEGLQTGVKRLSNAMSDALAKPTSMAGQAFDQLGVSVKNADGTMKSSSEVLGEMADAFKAMPDGAQKTALAMDLMGRSGADMIPLLNGGSGALNKLLGEASQFGQVFTAEMGVQAEAFNDNMSRLSGAFGAVSANVAQVLLPHLAKFTDWLVANSGTIGGWVQAAVSDFARLVAEVQAVITWVQQVLAVGERLAAEMPLKIQTMVNGVIAEFVRMKDAAIRIASEMVAGIELWMVDKMNEVAAKFRNPIDTFLSDIQQMYDKVVGHSIIPDMVTGVESWMDRLGSSFGSSIAGLVSGTLTWKEALGQLLQTVLQIASSGIGGGGGFFGSLMQGFVGGLPGFAQGGSFAVGGSGGIDSQLVAFRASPNETVSIHKPGNDNFAGGSMMVENVVHVEPSPFFVTTVDQRVASGVNNGLKRAPAMMADQQRRYG